MTVVRRFDRLEVKLDKATKMPNGWLRVDAAIGKADVVPYVQADGSVIHELRDPEEVFKADSLASFEMLPLTNDHPPEQLNDRNTRIYQTGHTGSDARRADDLARVSIMVTDAQTVADIGDGKIMISPGYTVEIDETPGVFNGKRYDRRQTNIVGNHVALVHDGRQGREVSLRLDAGDAIAAQEQDMRTDANKKLKIGEAEYDVPSQVATAYGKMEAKLAKFEKQIETAKGRKDGGCDGDLEKALARIDALEAEKVKAVDGKTDPKVEPKTDDNEKLLARIDALEAERKTFDTRVDERATAVSAAREVCGPEYKADGKTGRQLKTDVICKVLDRKVEDLKEKADSYIDGLFEFAVEKHAASKNRGDALLKVALGTGDREDEEVDAVEAARRKANEDRENAWKREED